MNAKRKIDNYYTIIILGLKRFTRLQLLQLLITIIQDIQTYLTWKLITSSNKT